MPLNLDITSLLIAVPIVLASLVLHELGHGVVAAWLGDPTAQRDGRLSLNPLRHLDPLGTLAILWTMSGGFGFGWAKPVMVNPLNLKYGPKNGMALVSIAGPAMNVLIALVAVFALQTMMLTGLGSTLDGTGIAANVLIKVIGINVGLAIFNMLPIPPLDGSKVFAAVLPDGLWLRYLRFEAWGVGILMLILAFGYFGQVSIIGSVMSPAAEGLVELMVTATALPAELIAHLFV